LRNKLACSRFVYQFARTPVAVSNQPLSSRFAGGRSCQRVPAVALNGDAAVIN
jgi:hypothetical protein